MIRHALLFLLGACMATVTIGETVLTIDASEKDILFTNNVALAKADRVVKTGPYKATIQYGTAKSSFDGIIEVQEGTLAAQYLQNFGTPTKITVSDGATLDLTSENTTATGTGYIANAKIYIAGTGVNGGGAIRRTGGIIINALLGTVTLTADARICNSVQIGCSGPINLEGHTLTIDAGIDGNKEYGSVFYFPNGQFMKNESTDDPGHVIVRNGTFFPTGTAMQGGSDNNTLTLQDTNGTLKRGRSCLRMRNLNTAVKWKLVVTGDSAGYIEDDEHGGGLNTWAGPVELQKQLTAHLKYADSRVTVAGDVTGHFPVANADGHMQGELFLTGTNDIGKITSRNGRTVFEGGKTTVNEKLDATAGSVTFKDETLVWKPGYALYVDGAKTSPVDVVMDNVCASSETNAHGGAGCRFYLGNGYEGDTISGRYGVLTVKNGSVMTNLGVSAGNDGFGAFFLTGNSVYHYPTFSAQYDSIGNSEGSYGYVSVSDGSTLTVDGSRITNKTAITTFWGAYGTAVLRARSNAKVNFIGTPDDSATHAEFAAYTGSRFSAYLEGGAKMTFPETLDFGRNASRAHSGAADVTLTGTGTVVKVGKYMRVFWTNADADFTLNLNDGAALESPNLYRIANTCQMKVNLNGGAIRKTSTSAWFSNRDAADTTSTTRLPTRVTVYEKGFTIDTSAVAASGDTPVKMEYDFQAPGAGKRIASIDLPTDAAFVSDTFMGPPTVRIAGSGQGATAFADYDEATRKVVGVIVTAPGWGYGDDTVVTMESGDRKSTYTCTFELEDPPETGWVGFRKTGERRLNMSGANTYRGATEVTEGILGFHRPNASQGGLPEGSGLILHKGATVTFDAANTPVAVPFIRGCGTTSFGWYTVTNAIEATVTDLAAGDHLTVNQKLILGAGVKVRILDAENLAALEGTNAKFLLLEAKNGLTLTDSDKLDLVLVVEGVERPADKWHVSVVGNKVYLRENTGMMVILR